jgi:CheY-like chemotaxis protein
MDLSMPKMDGFEAIDKIRKLLKIKTPILAITAHTQKMYILTA